MRDILCFEPIYQDRVWGGRVLETAFERALPADRPIGESWEIVDRPEAQSVVRAGALKGTTLRGVIEQHGPEVMGPNWPTDKAFPILVKWLDCRERLSLQVHPPVGVAKELNGEPKTENWYIAHSTADAHLLVGLRRGVTRQEFERAIASNSLEKCIHHFRVAAGDSILVRSGQVHAIDAGNLILEINRTLTRRIACTIGAEWDWTESRVSFTSLNPCALFSGMISTQLRCAARPLPARLQIAKNFRYAAWFWAPASVTPYPAENSRAY